MLLGRSQSQCDCSVALSPSDLRRDNIGLQMSGVNGRIHPFCCISPVKVQNINTHQPLSSQSDALNVWICLLGTVFFFCMFYSIWKLFILKKLANQNTLFWLLHVLCMMCTKYGSCVHPSFSLSMFHLRNYLTDFGMQVYNDHCHARLFWTIL